MEDQKLTYYLIENDRRVDVVNTREHVEARTQRGWLLVQTYSGMDWADVADAANDYAARQGKTCNGIPRVARGEEERKLLARVYLMILGWSKAGPGCEKDQK